MHVPSIITRALGWAAFELSIMQPFIPMYLHLIASGIIPIYAGAHASLSKPSSAAKKTTISKKDNLVTDEPEDDDLTPRMENLSAADAIVFPFLAGATLTGLYFLIKWMEDATLLNKILNWYFAGFSIFSVSRMISDGLDVVHSLAFPRVYVDNGVIFKVDGKNRIAASDTTASISRNSPLPSMFSRIPLPQAVMDFLWFLQRVPHRRLRVKAVVRHLLHAKFHLGIHGIEGVLIGFFAVLWYNFFSKPWWLTNLMGFGFAYGTLQILSPTTFWTGSLILSGLFFYDIYFVFFTPMMVTVAKSLDVPIKLLFPRPSQPDADPATQALSMLGLGDVVLPGIMIGLALRFDLYLFYLKKQRKEEAPSGNAEDLSPAVAVGEKEPVAEIIIKAPYVSVTGAWGDRLWTTSLLSVSSLAHGYVARNAFPKPYFHASLMGYLIGMITTLGAMQISNHAQPALLYLVPGVLAALWGTAWIRGEAKLMWTFSDAEEDTAERETTPTELEVDKTEVSEQAYDVLGTQGKPDGDSIDNKSAATKKSDRMFIHFSVMLPPPLPQSSSQIGVLSEEELKTERRNSLTNQETVDGEPAEKRRRIV